MNCNAIIYVTKVFHFSMPNACLGPANVQATIFSAYHVESFMKKRNKKYFVALQIKLVNV
ncbi:CLUMA_CG006861, isoform A [Clunio marinus]|uniref:CLUMA_CG006861, isoform A n=1 Tax=Clunio marinus TaxID=568069 RepID=A0A1J1HYY9_9DIPT|nr:CLUMA_CG006861, isoform A [Clunio marinus]